MSPPEQPARVSVKLWAPRIQAMRLGVAALRPRSPGARAHAAPPHTPPQPRRPAGPQRPGTRERAGPAAGCGAANSAVLARGHRKLPLCLRGAEDVQTSMWLWAGSHLLRKQAQEENTGIAQGFKERTQAVPGSLAAWAAAGGGVGAGVGADWPGGTRRPVSQLLASPLGNATMAISSILQETTFFVMCYHWRFAHGFCRAPNRSRKVVVLQTCRGCQAWAAPPQGPAGRAWCPHPI